MGVLAAARLGGLLPLIEVVRLVARVEVIRLGDLGAPLGSDAATVVGISRSRFVSLVGLLGPVPTVDPSPALRFRNEPAGLGVARRQPPALLRLGRLLPLVVVPVLVATAARLVALGGVV
jgi:hypothetical protein